MSFLNSYKKTGVTTNNEYTHSYSKSFVENGDTYIYVAAVGIDKRLLLSKLNDSGNIVWQKELNLSVFTTLTIEQILSSPNNFIVVTHNSNSIELIKFDKDGNILTIKRINTEVFKGQEGVYAEFNNDLLFLVYNSTILKVNLIGEIIDQKEIIHSHEGPAVPNSFYIDPGTGDMAICFKLNSVLGKFTFLIIDKNFNILSEIEIFDETGSSSPTPTTLIFHRIGNDTYIFFSSSFNFNGPLAIGLVRVNNNVIVDTDFLQKDQSSSSTNPALYTNFVIDGNQNVYLVIGRTIIKYPGTNLNPIWVKRISDFEQIKKLIYNPQTNFFSSRYSDPNTSLNYNYDAKVLHLDTNLTSCKTIDLAVQDSPNYGLTASITDNFSLENLSAPTVSGFPNVAHSISSNIFEYCPIVTDSLPDLVRSTIIASPTEILANGIATSVITVTLKDEDGITIDPSAYIVDIETTAGSWQTPVETDGNGVYTRTLRSSTTEETALLQFTVQGIGQGEDTATVDFIKLGTVININDNTALQSPYLYIQAAGSQGADSTRGRHLRWALRGVLGDKHLPKGNYAENTVNFNKPQDFVKIYRAAYSKIAVRLDFVTNSPTAVDNTNHLWIYQIEDKEFHLRFANTTKYTQVLQSINPLTQAVQFLVAYGGELIAIESATSLFFAATCNFNTAFSDSNTSVQLETLSVDENIPVTNKAVSNRIQLQNTEIGNSLRLTCENGKVIRGFTTGLHIGSIDFEFYDVLINNINSSTGWDELGDYALTLKDSIAFKQLEHSPGDVHGVWQRFNDDAYVNIKNYHQRWGASPEEGDRNIKQVVNEYIDLSNEESNPTAIESIPLGNDPNDSTDYVSISNLDLLNIAANDYHIARLLGLGIIDKDKPESFKVKDPKTGKQVSIQAYKSPLYVYVAEYYTVGDLEDGQGKRDVHHLFMTLPTSNNTSRLPIAIDINNIELGLSIGGNSDQALPLTDEDGYTHDGLSRYVSLYNQSLPEDQINVPFFNSNAPINLSAITYPVYGGIEYRMNNEDKWRKPELAKDIRYKNAVPDNEEPHFESRFLVIPSTNTAYFTHRQQVSGTHYYSSYGINWFSRATSSGTIVSIDTKLQPANPLLPPSNTMAHLIRSESPLLLTSASEQARLGAINPNQGDDNDNTLIRLSFDYHSYQELKNYQVPVDDPISNQTLINNTDTIFPDGDEIFAEEVDIFFRNEVPNKVIGKALSVTDYDSEETLSIIQTGDYFIASTGQTVVPTITSGTEDNYIGGIFTMGSDNYLIQAVVQSAQGPKFIVYKKEITESIVNGGVPSDSTNGELLAPEIIGDGYFMAFENMQTPDNWGSPNPNSFKIKVGIHSDIHREVITLVDDDGVEDRYLEKTRGIWSDQSSNHTTIESLDQNGDVTAQNTGLYKITFHGIQLEEHSQFNAEDKSVEWSGGIIRLFTQATIASGNPNGSRKVLPVLKIENVIRPGETGPFNDLVVYAQDGSFDPADTSYDAIQTGNNIEANFYPGYKIYLYADTAFGLTENLILPSEGEGMRYSIFGFRSHDTDEDFLSKISIPTVMYAQELIEALPPEQPEGGVYATRPDFYGRSTYTLTTKYQHKPHGVLFYRTNDEALLNSLYEKSTVREIREQLDLLGGQDEEYLNYRWQNFINFEELEADGDFKVYPPADVSNEGYKFPNPDKVSLYEWANAILGELGQPLITESPGDLTVGDPKILNFVKGYIYNAFAPLTEIPILYQYLNDEDYQPVAKKQTIYDRNGHTLPPVDPKTLGPDDEIPEFDMAPMMKIIDTSPNETLFTDFTLDGTSKNLYFYGVKELSTQMKMSDFSPFLGPIKLVNTNAPEAPEIKRIMPVLGNAVLGVSPKIQLEINAYPESQNIKKLTVYRSTNRLSAQSVRTMDIVKVIDLEAENLVGSPIWNVVDAFEDVTEVPYGSPLFYRITASREVEYADRDGNIVTEYAPSKSSKISATAIVEVINPDAPTLSYTSDALIEGSNEIHNVVLEWQKTCFNGKYHLYKMNNNGNWNKIHELTSNESTIELSLANTDLNSGSLTVVNSDGLNIYHHFKVIAENTSGMLSTEENILTISSSEPTNLAGIGSLKIGTTFTISN